MVRLNLCIVYYFAPDISSSTGRALRQGRPSKHTSWAGGCFPCSTTCCIRCAHPPRPALCASPRPALCASPRPGPPRSLSPPPPHPPRPALISPYSLPSFDSRLTPIPPQAPYFGYQRYNTRVDAHNRDSFLAFSEKQHKENMDDFEAIWLLQITKAAAKPATGRKTTSKSGTVDLIARMQGAPKAAGGRGSSADRSSPPRVPPSPPRSAAAAANGSPARPPQRDPASRNATPSPARGATAAAASPARGAAAAAASPGKNTASAASPRRP